MSETFHPVHTMSLSAAGLAAIKGHEGLRLVAYDDNGRLPGGTWTIGYGSTEGVTPGMRIDEEEASRRLVRDTAGAVNLVRSYVFVPVTQGMFDALVSFAFNLGPGRKGKKDGFVTLKSGRAPTLRRLLNAGDYLGAAMEFRKWTGGPAGTSDGLATRREKEAEMFMPGWREAAMRAGRL